MAAPTIGNPRPPVEASAKSKANLRSGIDGVRKARAEREAVEVERLAKQEAVVAELFNADAAALPDDLRSNPIVLNALRNKATAQAILNECYEKVHRQAAGAEDALEMALKLFTQVQAATTDVLAKWSKQAEDKPTQRIPRSVVDWIMNAESYSGPVVVQEAEK